MKRNKGAYERIIRIISPIDNYGSRISKKLNMTHAHVQKCIQKLLEDGIIIKLPRQTREIILELTGKGERIKQIYIDLDDAYSQNTSEENKNAN